MGEAKDIGNQGEDLAVKFLVEKGYKIIKRNWHFGKLEIDIIAMDKDTLVFVEVKTRSSGYIVEPELTLTLKQQHFLIRAANAFIDMNAYDTDARFDLISIVLYPEGYELNHIDEAFLFL